jgi:hypothetical protein
MPKKTFTPEQIVAKLRQVEVLISQGQRCRWPAKKPVSSIRPWHSICSIDSFRFSYFVWVVVSLQLRCSQRLSRQ